MESVALKSSFLAYDDRRKACTSLVTGSKAHTRFIRLPKDRVEIQLSHGSGLSPLVERLILATPVSQSGLRVRGDPTAKTVLINSLPSPYWEKNMS